MNLKDYKHIIWDWNGTLLDDANYCVGCMNQLLAERQMPLLNIQKYQDIFTFPVEDYYIKLGFDFEKESFDIVGHAFMDLYFAHLSTCQLHTDALKALSFFQKNNRQQFILSAMEHQSLISMLKKMNLETYFNGIYGIDNHLAAGKIERAKQMLEENHLDIQQTLLIGDTLHDQEVAEALGCQVILIAHGHQSNKRLMENAAEVLEDLSALIKC
jgi:phosphoglycolate phosphatase